MDKEKKKEVIGSTVEQLVNWKKDSDAYLASIGLTSEAPTNIRFYEGDQWPEASDKTNFIPRPVLNIIEKICDNKRSQILSSPVKIIYKSDAQDVGVEKFNRFANYQIKRLQLEELAEEIMLDGQQIGSYALYFYWDKDAVGIDGVADGDIGVQVYDPLNVRFANPNEKDEQKQEWIMLISRESVDKVKKSADKGVDLTLITKDDNESVYNESESDTEKYVTVMTRLFRCNGEVYFERATSSVVINEAKPITPKVYEIKEQLLEDSKKKPKNTKQEPINPKADKATKYPIMFSAYKERKHSIYGRGEVEKLIPNQKAINQSLSLQLLAGQNDAISAWIVKSGALRGQKITNAPGQVIHDYWTGQGDGVKQLHKNATSVASLGLAEKMADLTSSVAGSSEVMSGEIVSAGMSGAAIAQLQSQALKPIQSLQKAYWRSMEKVGEILEQFLRFYYTDKKFTYKDDKDNVVLENFNSSDYRTKHYDVVAEAVAGTIMSDVSTIAMIDNLFAKGIIDFKTYIECYPPNALANREQLKKAAEEQEQMLMIQLQQAQAQIQQLSQRIASDEKLIDQANNIVNQNNQLKRQMIQLQSEYAQKIQAANIILQGASRKAQEYKADATEFATALGTQQGLVQPNNLNNKQQ